MRLIKMAAMLGLAVVMISCVGPKSITLVQQGDVITAPNSDLVDRTTYSYFRDEPVSQQLQADVLYEEASRLLDMRGYSKVDSGGEILVHLSWEMEPRSRMSLDRQAELRYGTIGAIIELTSGHRATIDTVYTLSTHDYYQHYLTLELRTEDNENQMFVFTTETPYPTKEITKTGVVLMRDALTHIPMRSGYLPSAPSVDTTETPFRWALKNLYDRDFVPPGQNYIIHFPGPGVPGTSWYDPARLRKHFDAWNPDPRYLPVIPDLLARGWSSYAEPNDVPLRHYIIGTYEVDGRKERITLVSKLEDGYFVPAELRVEPL